MHAGDDVPRCNHGLLPTVNGARKRMRCNCFLKWGQVSMLLCSACCSAQHVCAQLLSQVLFQALVSFLTSGHANNAVKQCYIYGHARMQRNECPRKCCNMLLQHACSVWGAPAAQKQPTAEMQTLGAPPNRVCKNGSTEKPDSAVPGRAKNP